VQDSQVDYPSGVTTSLQFRQVEATLGRDLLRVTRLELTLKPILEVEVTLSYESLSISNCCCSITLELLRMSISSSSL
jgi:hypothetical protein